MCYLRVNPSSVCVWADCFSGSFPCGVNVPVVIISSCLSPSSFLLFGTCAITLNQLLGLPSRSPLTLSPAGQACLGSQKSGSRAVSVPSLRSREAFPAICSSVVTAGVVPVCTQERVLWASHREPSSKDSPKGDKLSSCPSGSRLCGPNIHSCSASQACW